MTKWQDYSTVKVEPDLAIEAPLNGASAAGRILPVSNPDFERRRRAWERFFATGEVDRNDVSDIVARSWRRCYAAGLDPRAPQVWVRQNPDELAVTIRRNSPYIEAALPFMRFLESAVRGTGHILVLTDSSGIVLD